MGFYLEDERLTSETSETIYKVEKPFQKVLKTLPDGEPIPQPLVMVGILTEQLAPLEEDADRHIKIVADNINETPSASVPPKTHKGIQWLLAKVRDSLDSERKRAVGRVLSQAGLTSPSRRSEVSSDEESSTEDCQDQTNSASDQASTTGTKTESNPPEDSASTNSGDSGTKKQETSDATSCEFCSATFRSESDLMSHAIQCDDRPADTRFTCQLCGNKYISQKALRQHLEDCNEADGVRITSSSRSSGDHSSPNTADKECDKCGETFDSKQQLILHEGECVQSDTRSGTATGTLVASDATGAVDSFQTERGFGFILTFDVENTASPRSNNGEDVFFHISEYPGTEPTVGERLQFDVRQTEEGYRAHNISLAHRRTPDPRDETFASERTRWGK